MLIPTDQGKLTVRQVFYKNSHEMDNYISEGDLPMSQEQQDQYKAIIGDGQGRITIGRDMSEMNFGSGGKVFVSVSLTCDQSYAGIAAAVGLAAQAADYFVETHYQQMKQRCLSLGLLETKPASARPQY